MPAKVIFTVQKGGLSGKSFTYNKKDSIILGRQDDCSIVLPESTVSRYHCLIDITPPSVAVRDFGSLNGTYLNGAKIGQRAAEVSVEEGREKKGDIFPLHSGDILGLGKECEIRVETALPQYCADCFCEIDNPDFTNPEGLLICPDCHEKRIEEENARQAAKKAEEEHLCAQKAAEEAAAREKAAADAKAKEDAERALKEALAKAAELKRKEEEEKKRRIELEEKRLAEQKRKEAENKERQNRRCEVCGDAITDKNAPEICPNCQKDPMKVLFFLMQRAKKGTGDAVQIAGYRNVKLLGQGGMGQVWLVEEEATGKQMALKVILPQAAANDASRKMFMREAQIGGQLKHKNIVSQYTCGQSGNTYFILMELCEGGSVDDLLAKNGGKLNLTLATDIILQVLDGLDYAHKADVSVKLASGETVKAQGIVHRDFKPGNIFLTRGSNNRFTAKVADFGLAKAFETSGLSGFSKDGQVAGTPNYMPRQQILNYLFSKPAVDVWAAAASYYSMLTGFPPKDFPKGQDVFFSMLNNSAVPILKRNSSIPKKLAAVIDQALVEKPNIGVQSATELKKMIEGAL